MFFSPNAPAADLTPDDQPGHITVIVKDDEGDAMEGLVVYAADARGLPVGSTKVDRAGRADIDLPKGGTYMLYTLNVPAGFQEHTDGDGSGTSGCAIEGSSTVRCVTVNVRGSVVSLPGSVDQLLTTHITYFDVTPKPRIRVIVRDHNTGKLVTGGHIVISEPTIKSVESNNTAGISVSDVPKGRSYTVTFDVLPKDYVLLPSSLRVQSAAVTNRLVEVEYWVVATNNAVDPMVSLEDEEPLIGIGGTDEFEAPVEEAPSEEAPVEATPAEDTPVDPDDALRADCFMYLEMYPQLTEIDPVLSSYCETNPAEARGIISDLLDELGL